MTFSTARECSPKRSLASRFVSPIYCVVDLLHWIMYTKLEEEHVMSHLSLFVCGEESVRCGSFFNKREHLSPNSITTEDSGLFRGWCAVFRSDKDFT